MVPRARTKGNWHKVEDEQFCLSIGKPFLNMRMRETWHRLPREVVKSSSLEIFKSHVDMVLDNLLWVALLREGGWVRRLAEVPANFSHWDSDLQCLVSFRSLVCLVLSCGLAELLSTFNF